MFRVSGQLSGCSRSVLVATFSLVLLGCAASSGLVVSWHWKSGLRFFVVVVVVFEGAALDFDVVCSGLRVRAGVFLFGTPLVLGLVCFSSAALFASATSSWSFLAAHLDLCYLLARSRVPPCRVRGACLLLRFLAEGDTLGSTWFHPR